MGRIKKRFKKFNYDKNRKKSWKKRNKMPTVQCEHIKEEWDSKKSAEANMKNMGLSIDANKTIQKGKSKSKKLQDEVMESVAKVNRTKVIKAMEAEASLPEKKILTLSEPEVRFCTYMMDTYGDDHKAMARDSKNYYQDTPKQIRRKINTFKGIPSQYQAYLQEKQQKNHVS